LDVPIARHRSGREKTHAPDDGKVRKKPNVGFIDDNPVT
jgi:hypothetical protein